MGSDIRKCRYDGIIPQTLPGYTFEPTTIDILDTTIDLVTTDKNEIGNDAQNANTLHTQHLDKPGQSKQMTILEGMEKIILIFNR